MNSIRLSNSNLQVLITTKINQHFIYIIVGGTGYFLLNVEPELVKFSLSNMGRIRRGKKLICEK
jgi:hypothetical protein